MIRIIEIQYEDELIEDDEMLNILNSTFELYTNAVKRIRVKE